MMPLARADDGSITSWEDLKKPKDGKKRKIDRKSVV